MMKSFIKLKGDGKLRERQKKSLQWLETSRKKSYGKNRRCKKCGKKLSMYNSENLCFTHQARKKKEYKI